MVGVCNHVCAAKIGPQATPDAPADGVLETTRDPPQPSVPFPDKPPRRNHHEPQG